MTKLYVILFISCVVTTPALAQECDQASAFASFHANDIRTIISNGGDLFWDLENNTFQVPFSGPETPHMIFAGGVWLAGIDESGDLKLAAQQYRYNERNDYAPGPLNSEGEIDVVTCANWDRIWKVLRHDVLKHIMDYNDNQVVDERIRSVFSWPGFGNQFFTQYNGFDLPEMDHLSAPFYDANTNGRYDPDLGEYPLPDQLAPMAIPMLTTWSVFNDAGVVHANSNGDPLHAEFQLTTYAFSCDGTSNLNQTLFTSYRIVNRSDTRIDSLIFGQWLDPDLGCHTDDIMGSYPEGNSLFVYNEDPVDGQVNEICPAEISSYAEYPPVLSVTFLNHEMSSMMYYMTGGLWGGPAAMTEPASPTEFYNYLNGRWRDGLPLSRGGLGYNIPPTETTTFAYPDNPNLQDGWSMYNEDITADRRLIASCDLGQLEPGDVVTVDLAFAYHLDSTLSHVENVEPMYTTIQSLLVDYSKGFEGVCAFDQTICDDDCVYPGDADHDGKVTVRDFLNIAVALTDTGASRSGPLAWLPHMVDDWNLTSVTGADSKHADSDGNGLVDLMDMTIADMNYGLQTPEHSDAPSEFGQEIRIIPEANVMEVGKNFFRVDVEFDNPGIDSLYGLAYTVGYDKTYFLTAVVQNHFSVIGDQEPIYQDIKIRNGAFDCVEVATDLKNRPVDSGPLLVFYLFGDHMVEIHGGGDTTYFEVRDVKAVMSDGSVVNMHGQRVPVVVVDPVSDTEVTPDNPVRVYPNPSSGEVFIAYESDEEVMYTVFSTDGKKVHSGWIANGQASLTLPAGMYVVKMHYRDTTSHFRVIVTD